MAFRKRLAVGAVLSASTIVVGTTPAGANAFPGNSVGKVADNSQHTLCRSDLTAAVSNAVAWTRDRVDDTDMSAVILACTSDTDSVNYDQDYTTFGGQTWHGSGGTVVGLNICVSESKSTCDQSEDRYDLSWVPTAGLNNQRWVALHEIGHSIGFGHDDSGGQVMNSSANGMTNYSPHERDHINAQW